MTSRTLFGINNAQRYFMNHSLQIEHAKLLLQKYQRIIKWNEKKNIIDIGCGPGDVTKEHLLPLISTDGEILGIDISPSMIDYAKSNYGHPRLNYEVMDIESSSIDDKYRSAFDLAVSFYCFHMIQDQRTAMNNLCSVLRNGGETLLMFVASSSYYNQHQILASNSKWSPYLYDLEKYITPYQNSIDPVSEVTNLMQDIGFKVEDCICELKSYEYQTKEIFLDSMLALNPFLLRIPHSLRDEYIEDFKRRMLSIVSNETIFSYPTMIVFARKSSVMTLTSVPDAVNRGRLTSTDLNRILVGLKSIDDLFEDLNAVTQK